MITLPTRNRHNRICCSLPTSSIGIITSSTQTITNLHGIPAAAPPVSQDKAKTSPQRVTNSEVEVEVAEHASLTTTSAVPTTFHSTLDTLAAVATSLLELSGTVVIGTGTADRDARPKTAPLPRDRIDKRASRKDPVLNFVQVSSADREGRPDKDVPFDTNLHIRSSHIPPPPVDRSRKRIMETIDLTTDGSQPQQPLKCREIGNQAPWYPVAGFQYRKTGVSHGDHTMPELAARLARFEAYKGRYNTMYNDIRWDRNLRSQAANLLISYLIAERQATGPVHPLGNNPLVMSQPYQSATRLPHPLHLHTHRQEHDANTAYDHASPPSLPVPPPPLLPNGNGNGPVSNVTLMPHHAPPPLPQQHHRNRYQRRERRESRPPYMQSPYHTNPTTTVWDASATPPSPAPFPQQPQPQQPPSTLWNHPHPQNHRHHQHQQQQRQQQQQAYPHHHPYAPYAHAISTSKGLSPPSTHKRPGAKRRSPPSPPPTSPSSQRRRGGGGRKTVHRSFTSVPSSSVASGSTDSRDRRRGCGPGWGWGGP
ncbi:hypothetical protein HKX48_006381 [Thoreauomyces humboldtii]|nr:hypothetical protein HKX48_006381 [Thoreauomyces humboldtii]